MPARVEDRELARRVNPPAASVVRPKLREYMALCDMAAAEVAERTGYARSSVHLFLQDSYDHVGDDLYIRAAIWELMQREPVSADGGVRNVKGNLFHTENYRRIRKYFEAAVIRGEVCLLYGPPGTQKSFVLQHMVAERNREKKNDAIYVYASAGMTRGATALLRRIARASGAVSRVLGAERMIQNILRNFAKRLAPPAIVVDEAQHLGVESLEVLRELHDLSECGLVLAGSHNLYENFLRGRAHLEQWLSRIDHKNPLPGLQEDEIKAIAERETSNGHRAHLGEKQLQALVKACRVEDVFARDAQGKPAPQPYLSVRRLVKVLAQQKETKEAA